MHDGIHVIRDKDVLGHIVLVEAESLLTEEVRNVVNSAGNKVVQADNLMFQRQQPLVEPQACHQGRDDGAIQAMAAH